jgi:hypothetical protein
LYYSIASLHSTPSQERDVDSLSAVQETSPIKESFSTVMPDTEPMPIEQRHEQQTLCYSRSLCVPYADEQDGIYKTKKLIIL